MDDDTCECGEKQQDQLPSMRYIYVLTYFSYLHLVPDRDDRRQP
jgi:hypothetical protein